MSRETERRTAEFSFNGLDGVYIQDNGHGARKYPLRCIFSGNDHDRIATQFEDSLLTKGVGELEHPLYGTFPVVPVGSITRRNDLVAEANQSVVEVTFSTTLASVYPSGQGFPVSELQASISDFDLAAALQFSQTVSLSSAVQKASIKSVVRSALAEVRSGFEQLSGPLAQARRTVAEQQALINESIDVLVGAPLNLGQQLVNFALTPSRAFAGYIGRLEGYGRMIDGILRNFSSTSGDDSQLLVTIEAKRNELRVADLMALSAVAGSVNSIVDQKYSTRPEALQAAETILNQMDLVVAWRDKRFDALGLTDTGEAYQAVQKAVAQAAGYLVESSFSLVPERRIVLDRARTILDVCGQLYGSTSNDRIDFLINSNSLSGDEILELPRGRVISYYVN